MHTIFTTLRALSQRNRAFAQTLAGARAKARLLSINWRTGRLLREESRTRGLALRDVARATPRHGGGLLLVAGVRPMYVDDLFLLSDKLQMPLGDLFESVRAKR